jgi:Amt family ammonium transporter
MQVLLPRSAKASSLIAGTALLLLTSPAIAGNDPTPNPGDTTWMLTSSLLVLMMSIICSLFNKTEPFVNRLMLFERN